MINDENAPPEGMAKGLVKTVSANQMGVSFLSAERQTAMEEAMRYHEGQVRFILQSWYMHVRSAAARSIEAAVRPPDILGCVCCVLFVMGGRWSRRTGWSWWRRGKRTPFSSCVC
eukprot:COSAG02_NODE_664_length_18739_cov_11.071567_8_plen_115_part_00